jgi:siroheme synthase
MGVRAARFVQGRLLLHGAEPTRPVTVVENASRPDEKRVATTLGELPEALAAAGVKGPAIILVGLTAAAARAQPVETAPALAAGAVS